MNGLSIRLPKRKIIKISLSKESLAQYALFMFLCSEAIRDILEMIIGNSTIGTYITIVLLYFPVILIVLQKQFKAYDYLVLWFIIVLAFAISYIMYPQNAYYFTRKTYGVLYRVLRLDRPIYGYLFIRLCNDKERIMKTLEKASILLLIYYVFTLLNSFKVGYWLEYNGKGVLVQRSYSLVFGYNCALPTIFFLYKSFLTFKLKYIAPFLVGLACIIMGGSRGALICPTVFALFYMIKNRKKLFKRPAFLVLSIIAIFFVLFLACGGGLILLSALKKSGIESRTIEKLLEGTISDDNGRNTIWAMAVEMIRNGGFWGYGLYGDRPVISSFHYAGYCHNIFLELLTNLGVPIGGLLSIVIVYQSLKMLLFCPDDDWRNLFLIFFSCSCELLISMSFWYVNYFWLAFAIGVNYSRTCKKRRIWRK